MSSSTHSKALIAIEKYGIEAVKWKRGFTALHWAEKIGRSDIVSFLLRCGADPNAKDDDGLMPKDYREKRKEEVLFSIVNMETLPESHRRCIEVISKHGWGNMKWAGGWTIMHWAFQEGREDVVKYLKSIGVGTDMKDDKGKLPVDYCRDGGRRNFSFN